jgi:hypothetical protein
MRRLSIYCVCMAACVAAGCSTDYQQIGDAQVESVMSGFDGKLEAIPFFEGKGRYFDSDSSTTVDKDVVLPLLKVLKEIAPTEQWVIPQEEDPKTAFAVFVKLPGDVKVASRMADAVEAADDKFPGLILQQWGHEWLSFDLMPEETYKILKAKDPEIDQQRPDSLRAS